MPRRAASCWIILLALSEASVSITASRSRSNSAICVSTNSSRTSKRLILACAFAGSGSPRAVRNSGMDPEDLREVITAYQKCVAATVERLGGFVAKYMGDGVLIYFGYPQAHEDDAE